MASVQDNLSGARGGGVIVYRPAEQFSVVFETKRADIPSAEKDAERCQKNGKNEEVPAEKGGQSSSVAEDKLTSALAQVKLRPGVTGHNRKILRLPGNIRPRGPANVTDSGKGRPKPTKPNNAGNKRA